MPNEDPISQSRSPQSPPPSSWLLGTEHFDDRENPRSVQFFSERLWAYNACPQIMSRLLGTIAGLTPCQIQKRPLRRCRSCEHHTWSEGSGSPAARCPGKHLMNQQILPPVFTQVVSSLGCQKRILMSRVIPTKLGPQLSWCKCLLHLKAPLKMLGHQSRTPKPASLFQLALPRVYQLCARPCSSLRFHVYTSFVFIT